MQGYASVSGASSDRAAQVLMAVMLAVSGAAIQGSTFH
jgi:hypothetical protein